jgi:hypothetical protein
MLKGLFQFAIAVLLLLVAASFIHSGRPSGAIAIFVAVAGYFTWRLIRTGTAQPGSDGRRAKVDLLRLLFIALWLASLILVTGVLGNHPDIVTALASIAVAIGVVRTIKDRKTPD